MSTAERSPNRSTSKGTGRPPAIGRSAINEFRKARAQFRQDRAAADAAAEAALFGPRLATPLPGPAGPDVAADAEAGADAGVPAGATVEPLVLLSHGEPLSLALSRRRRDESANIDRRLRLSRLVAREGQINAAVAELSVDQTIDLRDGGADAESTSEVLAPVVDLRERAEARQASARAAADVTDAEPTPLS